MTRTILSLVACGSLLVACGDDTTGTGGGGQGGDNAGGSGQTTTTSTSTMGTGGGGEGGGTPAENAQIRAVHASPDAPAVDVCVLNPSDMVIAGPALGAGELAYPGATPYIPLPAGSYKFRLVAGDATDCNTAIFTTGVIELEAGEAYSAVAVGLAAASPSTFDVVALQDNLGTPAAGNAHLRFIHAASDVPAVDVGTVDGGGSVTDVWTNIAYKSAGDYTPVPGPFTADVGVALNSDTTSTSAISFTDIDIPAGAIVDIFAIGLLTGTGDQALGAMACVVGGACAQLTVLD